jgi:DNA adenine methylase
MKIAIPPLKSQGIKTKLAPWILSHVPTDAERWIEPFLGSGVVGFNAGFDRSIFNEINPHIVAFYRGIQCGDITPQSVRHYLRKEGELLRVAEDAGYAHYRFVRDRFNTEFAPLDFLFLNRAGFNGMMRFSKAGKWNIPFCQKPDRFAQAYVTKIVNQVAAVARLMRPGWQFTSRTYGEVIAEATEKDIIYCDPPYFGRYTDYYNDWKEDQERALFDSLSSSRARFILSTWHHNAFRRNESIEKYWQQFTIVTKEHFYHAGAKEENRRSITEALVMNFDPSPTVANEAESTALQLTLV